jgi:hypothetical protein
MLDMSGAGQRFYEDDEAEQILNLAASISSPAGSMSHERLLETAAELGISPEAVEAAEKQITELRLDKKLRSEFDANQRRAFFGGLTAFLGFNTFLVVVTHGFHFWMIWVTGFWGLGVISHSITTLFPRSAAYKERYRVWKSERLGRPLEAEAISDAPNIVVGVHVGAGRHAKIRQRRAERLERHDRI